MARKIIFLSGGGFKENTEKPMTEKKQTQKKVLTSVFACVLMAAQVWVVQIYHREIAKQ